MTTASNPPPQPIAGGSDRVRKLRSDKVVWREVGGEIVALGLERSDYLVASPSARELWKRLADGATLSDLSGALCERYDLSPQRGRDDAEAFLAELDQQGWLES
jgi:hypothetical protein